MAILNEKILSVCVKKDLVLVGGTSKYMRKMSLDGKVVNLVKHDKSIRSVTIKDDMFACASYDGKASIFKNNEFLETLEGPDTEIKCIRIDKYIALSTRSGDVWIYNKEGDIEALIHEDGDVKGIYWHDGMIFTFGYDNTIKLYSKIEEWELIQNLKQDSIIWDMAIFNKKLITCDNNGFLWIYNLENIYVFDKKIEASKYPIFKICASNEYLFYIANRNIINVLDKSFKLVNFIYCQQDSYKESDGYREDINCIDYCKDSNILVAGGDKMILLYSIE